jgi:hypothetical protein
MFQWPVFQWLVFQWLVFQWLVFQWLVFQWLVFQWLVFQWLVFQWLVFHWPVFGEGSSEPYSTRCDNRNIEAGAFRNIDRGSRRGSSANPAGLSIGFYTSHGA